MDYDGLLNKKPLVESEVIVNELQSIRADVVISASTDFFEIGQLLKSTDFLEFEKVTTGDDPVGVLAERVYSDGIDSVVSAKIVLTGAVRENKLVGFEEAMRVTLLTNKIILK